MGRHWVCRYQHDFRGLSSSESLRRHAGSEENLNSNSRASYEPAANYCQTWRNCWKQQTVSHQCFLDKSGAEIYVRWNDKGEEQSNLLVCSSSMHVKSTWLPANGAEVECNCVQCHFADKRLDEFKQSHWWCAPSSHWASIANPIWKNCRENNIQNRKWLAWDPVLVSGAWYEW